MSANTHLRRDSSPLKDSRDRTDIDTQGLSVSTPDDTGHFPIDTHSTNAGIIGEIIALGRHRRAHQKADIRLEQEIMAQYRALCDGDKDEAKRLYKAVTSVTKDHPLKKQALCLTPAFFAARIPLEATIKGLDKEIAALVKQIPAHEWWISHKGLAVGGLGSIIAETGDLNNYPSPSHLWSRLGLSVDAEGRAIKARKGVNNGYSPMRRAVSWKIVDAFLKHQGGSIDPKTGEFKSPPTELKRLYLDRKEYELQRNPEMTRRHAHFRAQRYVEKRLLKRLWRAWRGQTATKSLTPKVTLPDAPAKTISATTESNVMQTGRGGMGSRKHGKSGHPGKSPKLRQHLKREAEKEPPKRGRVKTEFKPTVHELLDKGG